MSTRSDELIEEFFKNLVPLRQYAERMILNGEILSEEEEIERLYLLADFLSVAAELDLTWKDIAVALFKTISAETEHS